MIPAYNPAEGYDTDVSPSGITVMDAVDTDDGTGRNYSTTASSDDSDSGDGSDSGGLTDTGPKTAAAALGIAALAYYAGRGS